MTKTTAALAFPFLDMTLPEDTGCRKLSVGIYKGILTSFRDGLIVLFLQMLSEVIVSVTVSTSQRLQR